jgi:hypothetical protein
MCQCMKGILIYSKWVTNHSINGSHAVYELDHSVRKSICYEHSMHRVDSHLLLFLDLMLDLIESALRND